MAILKRPWGFYSSLITLDWVMPLVQRNETARFGVGLLVAACWFLFDAWQCFPANLSFHNPHWQRTIQRRDNP